MSLIEKFFGGLNTQTFMQTYWPDKVFVHDGDIERLGDIVSVPEFYDIEMLLKHRLASVDLVYPDGKREIITRPIDALSKYERGEAMLYLKELEEFPEISSACDELASIFQVPRCYISCEGFAATGEVHVPVHFDHETNFMIQIRGKKTWTFSKNNSLPHPIFPYFPANPNRYYDSGKNPFTGDSLPDGMPEPYIERNVGPGTVTFMPRGYWHSTESSEPSFAIGFVINPPTVAEIVAAGMLSKLHQMEACRVNPLSVHTSDGKEALIKQFQSMLETIHEQAQQVCPEALLRRYLSTSDKDSRTLLYPR